MHPDIDTVLQFTWLILLAALAAGFLGCLLFYSTYAWLEVRLLLPPALAQRLLRPSSAEGAAMIQSYAPHSPGESLLSCGPARANGDALAMVAPAKPGGSVRTSRRGRS